MADELILFVEDNPKNLKLVRDALQVKGYQTIEAETGEEGVRLAQERHPALILMDIPLPGINGIEAPAGTAGRSSHSPHAGHRHHGLGDDPRPKANHGRWVRWLPGQTDQRLQSTIHFGSFRLDRLSRRALEFWPLSEPNSSVLNCPTWRK